MASQPSWPCQYRGSFEQIRTLAGTELAVKSQGRFWQDCTLGLVWQVNKPRQESRVYTRSQNDLLISQTGSVKALNGLVERRVGVLLRTVFEGNHEALFEDFVVLDSNETEVELQPRDARVKAQLNALFLGGDATRAYVRLDTPSDTLSIQLADFAEHDGAQGVCREWLDDQNDVCRALRSPRQRLEATGDN
jgi:hypothetical protein